MSEHYPAQHDEGVACGGCGHDWPCPASELAEGWPTDGAMAAATYLHRTERQRQQQQHRAAVRRLRLSGRRLSVVLEHVRHRWAGGVRRLADDDGRVLQAVCGRPFALGTQQRDLDAHLPVQSRCAAGCY